MAESLENHVPGLFYIFASLALIYFIYNLKRAFVVRIGRPEVRRIRPITALWNGLLLGIGQRRVTSKRFGFASVMHFCLGWGFIELFFATTVDFVVARGFLVDLLPAKDTPWFATLNELGGLLLMVGILLALGRRHSRAKPELLPQNSFGGRGSLLGDTGVLVVLMLLVLGGFLAEAARLAIESPATASSSFIAYPISMALPASIWGSLEGWLWWSHAFLALAFIAVLPNTKLYHAIIAIVNVTLTSVDERGSLRAMNITQIMEDPDADEDALVMGVGQVSDFTWKQLLDTQACTECARCSAVCPANAVGMPLSPMKVIQDIRSNLYAETMGEGESRQLIGGAISITELWSCTTCGACQDVCPVLVDHIPAIVDMRRHLVLSEGQPPADGAPALENMTLQGNPWGFPRDNRLKWAADAGLDLPLIADKGEAEVLWWVGCAGAYDPRNQEISRKIAKILMAANVDFAVLGQEETCTGDSARRMGEEYVYETLALQNIEMLSKYKFDKILTGCPHCFQTLGGDYRQMGGEYHVVHHSQFISELIETGKLTTGSNNGDKIVYHDACYLGRHNNIYDAPRDVIAKTLSADGQMIESDQAKRESFCCGAGGGNMWYEINEGERINLARFDQLTATGADTIATACSFCAIMLDDAAKVRGMEDQVKVRDIAEIVADSMES